MVEIVYTLLYAVTTCYLAIEIMTQRNLMGEAANQSLTMSNMEILLILLLQLIIYVLVWIFYKNTKKG